MKGILFGAVMGAAALAAGTAAAAPKFNAATGSYYDYINRDQADTDFTKWSWTAAKADAEQRSFNGRKGHLVTLTSKAEEQFLIANWIADILYGQPWIGAYRPAGEGGTDPNTGWRWVTGEAWGHTNWFTGEPNDSPPADTELYVHYMSVNVASVTQFGGYGWNDLKNDNIRSYFIEYSAIPEPGALALLAGGLLGAAAMRRRRG